MDEPNWDAKKVEFWDRAWRLYHLATPRVRASEDAWLGVDAWEDERSLTVGAVRFEFGIHEDGSKKLEASYPPGSGGGHTPIYMGRRYTPREDEELYPDTRLNPDGVEIPFDEDLDDVLNRELFAAAFDNLKKNMLLDDLADA
jgi:hypothetical protein